MIPCIYPSRENIKNVQGHISDAMTMNALANNRPKNVCSLHEKIINIAKTIWIVCSLIGLACIALGMGIIFLYNVITFYFMVKG